MLQVDTPVNPILLSCSSFQCLYRHFGRFKNITPCDIHFTCTSADYSTLKA